MLTKFKRNQAKSKKFSLNNHKMFKNEERRRRKRKWIWFTMNAGSAILTVIRRSWGGRWAKKWDHMKRKRGIRSWRGICDGGSCSSRMLQLPRFLSSASLNLICNNVERNSNLLCDVCLRFMDFHYYFCIVFISPALCHLQFTLSSIATHTHEPTL